MSLLENFSKISLADAPTASVEAVTSNEEKALASQFQTLAPRFAAEPESLAEFNQSLKTKTFVAGNELTSADLAVFGHVLPLAKQWTSVEDLAKFRHVLRWVELLQTRVVDVPVAEQIKIDYDVQLPREIKEKKKPAAKDGAAPAAAEKKDVPAAVPAAAAAAAGGELSEEQKKANADAAKAKKAAKAKAKAEANAKAQAAAAAAVVPPNPAMIDFRVGFIQKCVKHPDADSLYMSTIDMGDEDGPRTVCSGLVNYIPIEDMQQRYIVTVANLKPVTMRGVKSTAMVLCASNSDTVEFVNPPAGSKAGEKIFFEGYDGVPEKQLNPKKKIWEAVQPGFSTSEALDVTYTVEGKAPARLVNARGELCKASTIVGAAVK